MKKLSALFVCAALTLCTLVSAQEQTKPAGPVMTEKGIVLDCGDLGSFTLLYPSFVLGDDYNKAQAKVEGNKATITYTVPKSPVIEAVMEDGVIQFSMKTETAGKLNFGCYLPTTLAGKATAQLGLGGADDKKVEFPKEAAKPPHLLQGDNTYFELVGLNGKGFSLQFSQKGYWQLQDNRAWNWDVNLLTYKMNAYGNRDNQTFSLTIKLLP